MVEEANFKENRVRGITHLYYSKPEVQKALFEFSQNREISPRYFEGFGKRPDTFQYPGDIYEMVKKGATSFHCSEELWNDPMDISIDASQKQNNELRIGWDFLIDIDSRYIDYSKIMAELIINMLKFHGVKNVGIKFSVSGDAPILVEENKEISLISIREAISLLKKRKNLKVLSLDKNRKLVYSKIYNFLEHKDSLYEIKHSMSTLPLKATGHHSVLLKTKSFNKQKFKSNK